MNSKKLLFTLRHAPYGSSLAKDSIDAILATSAYDQDLSVLFMDDGVFQLLNEQQADTIQQKSISNMLSAFAIYDIDQLFVCSDSLTERGICPESINEDVTLLSTSDIQTLLSQQDHLLSF